MSFLLNMPPLSYSPGLGSIYIPVTTFFSVHPIKNKLRQGQHPAMLQSTLTLYPKNGCNYTA